MKSLSEIETTVKRASRAAGYSWGIAEEVGKSIRLSELFGFPGIKHLNQYYQNKKKENFDDVKLIDKINKSNGLSFCPITLGVNFIDQIKSDGFEDIASCTFSIYQNKALDIIKNINNVIDEVEEIFKSSHGDLEMNKKKYCYVGNLGGKRSCAEINESDKCISGDVFPSEQICINPNLRK